MDKLNEKWLKGKPNFYFKYKRQLIESMIEGSCLNVGCGSHIISNATNIDEGLPRLPYPDNSFDTVICSDVLEHIGPHKQSVVELLRVARRKLIITAPAYRWLYSKYDVLLGHKCRYYANDFSGFEITHLFWFLVPLLFLRKLLGLRHRPLPEFIENMFLKLSKIHLSFGTTILAVKYKVPYQAEKKYKVSLFVPVFNEEKIIDRDIKAIDYIIKHLPVEYEIFIVNDASQDKTKIIAEKIEQSNRKVTLLNYTIGPTRRENLAQSFNKASGDIIAFVDIDLLASLRFLPDLIDQIRAGYDIVSGSRYVRGSRIERKPFRLIVSILYNFWIRSVFRTNIRDHMCGFKAFKREVILRLVEEMGYDRSLKRGIFWDTELLVRAVQRGYKIKEIPIWWKERNKSALYFRREIRSLFYALRLIRKLKRQNKISKALDVLYITYDGLCDPLGQSQVVPYLIGLTKSNVKIYILSFEKKEAFKKTNLLNQTEQILRQNAIEWRHLKYHKSPRLLATFYDVIYGYICGLLLIKKHHFNIIHARGYISALIASCLKKTTRIKFVFDMRGFWVEEKVDAGFWNKTSMSYKIAKSLEKVMLNLADYIIVLTEKAKLILVDNRVKLQESIEVIPTCVDLNNFKPLEGLKKNFLQDKVVVLHSGSIGTFYGFREAVKFFQVFYSKEKRAFFLALINNQKEIAENILKTCHIPPDAYRVSSLLHAEVPDWVKEADVSLMLYHRDNSSAGCWPTKFAESLACGVPVVVNKGVGGCDNMVNQEKIGFVLEDFTDLEYKKVIDLLLSALKERDILRERCHKIAEKFFSLESGVEKYFQVYNRLR